MELLEDRVVLVNGGSQGVGAPFFARRTAVAGMTARRAPGAFVGSRPGRRRGRLDRRGVRPAAP
jgi:hypothetical protein